MKYNLFSPFWMSFYSRQIYRDAKDWKGAGLKYIFVMSFALTLLFGALIHLYVQKYFKENAPALIRQVPTLTMTSGKLSTEEQKVYEIKEPLTGQLLAVIDTSKTELPSDLGQATAYVVQTKMAYQKNPGSTTINDFSKSRDFQITQNDLTGWAKAIAQWAAFVLFPFILIFSFIIYIIQILFLSLATLSFSKVMNLELSYAACFRLTVLAFIPVSLFFNFLDVIRGLLNFPIPFMGVLFFIAALVYIYFAVDSLKNSADA